ncbi:hypothetical protein BSKO_03766 [Bryopsis sp. KO-2023]|nr:hypothetical protein BSKO_03766 [Bryopsis sp. KO-2023]
MELGGNATENDNPVRASTKTASLSGLRPPHLSLCYLIRLYATGQTSPLPFPVTPRFIGRLAEFLLEQIKGEDDIQYPPFTGLIERLKRSLEDEGRGVGEWLWLELKKVTTADSVVRVMADFHQLLTKKPRPPYLEKEQEKENSRVGVRPDSIFGMYIRHCNVTFEEMHYEHLSWLAAEVNQYVAELNHQGSSTAPLPGLGGCRKEAPALDKFLNNQVSKVDRGVECDSDVLQKMDTLKPLEAEHPRQLLWRHEVAIKERDYLAAMDSLFRYFDYHHASRCGGQGVVDEAEIVAIGQMLQSRFPNAILSMSSSQAAFGHVEEALNGLLQTIRLNPDNFCVVHTLAALCHILLSAVPWALKGGPARDIIWDPSATLSLLKRCMARVTKMRLPHLVAFCRMALARFSLKYGMAVSEYKRNYAPCAAGIASMVSPTADVHLELLQAHQDVMRLHAHVCLASSVVEYKHGHAGARFPDIQTSDIFTASLSVFGQSAREFRRPAADVVTQTAGSVSLLRSAAWNMFGDNQLSLAHAVIHKECYSDDASATERATAFAQLATNIAARRGLEAAEGIFQIGEKLFPLEKMTPLVLAKKCLAVERAINRNGNDVLELVTELTLLADPSCATDVSVEMEAELWGVKALMAIGKYKEAIASGQEIFSRCLTAGLQEKAATLLLLHARIFIAAGSLATIRFVLSCLEQCSRLHLDLLAAEASVVLAKIWVDQDHGHAEHAIGLIRSVQPLIESQGSLLLGSEAKLTMAECMLCTIDDLRVSRDQTIVIVDMLQLAVQGFKTVECWKKALEALYLMAKISDEVNDMEARCDIVGEIKEVEMQRHPVLFIQETYPPSSVRRGMDEYMQEAHPLSTVVEGDEDGEMSSGERRN